MYMSKERELEEIRNRGQEALHCKQLAWKAYIETESRFAMARTALQSTWDKRCAAKKRMDYEYESLRQAREDYWEVWSEYYDSYSRNFLRINILEYKSKHEYQEMSDCLEQANHEHKYGTEAAASAHYQEGCRHKRLYEDLNSEISELIQGNLYLKEDAKRRAPKPDTSDFDEARQVFKDAKSNYEIARDIFECLKTECEHKEDDFRLARESYDKIKEEYQEKLKEYGLQESSSDDVM